MRDCGTCQLPADGTPGRERMDRFADFLREAGPPMKAADLETGRARLRTPAERYRVGFLAWRLGAPLDLVEP